MSKTAGLGGSLGSTMPTEFMLLTQVRTFYRNNLLTQCHTYISNVREGFHPKQLPKTNIEQDPRGRS